MPLAKHPDLEILKFVANIEGREPLEVIVKGADKIDIKIPENSKYSMTVFFHVKNRTLKNLKYIQVIKKAGVTVKQRELEIGEEFEPSEEKVYSKTFPEDTTPGGFLFRGLYPATSTYYAGDEELMVVDWQLEITKK